MVLVAVCLFGEIKFGVSATFACARAPHPAPVVGQCNRRVCVCARVSGMQTAMAISERACNCCRTIRRLAQL